MSSLAFDLKVDFVYCKNEPRVTTFSIYEVSAAILLYFSSFKQVISPTKFKDSLQKTRLEAFRPTLVRR